MLICADLLTCVVLCQCHQLMAYARSSADALAAQIERAGTTAPVQWKSVFKTPLHTAGYDLFITLDPTALSRYKLAQSILLPPTAVAAVQLPAVPLFSCFLITVLCL